MGLRRAATLGCVALAMVSASHRTSAQAGPTSRAVLIFTVIDESDIAVRGTTIDIGASSGSSRSAVTDSLGRATIAVEPASRPRRYVVRRIGFTQVVDSIVVERPDTLSLLVHLARVVATLDTVRSNARLPSNYYFLGADEIARSKRHPENAYEAITAIRPTLLGDVMRMCRYIQDLWVNGERQIIPPWTPLVPRWSTRTTRTDLSGREAPTGGFPLSHAPSDAPLARIKAQHIEEMHYTSCWQTSDVGRHGVNALFVTLKPGIGFDLKYGTYVADSAAARAAHVIP